MTSRLFSINSIQSILVLNSLLLILLVVDKTMAALPFNLTYQSVKRLHQLQEVKGRILTGLRLEQAPVLPNGLKRPALQKALSQLHDSAAVSGHGNYNYPESVAFILFSKPPDFTVDKNIMEFQLNGQNTGKYIEVKSASLFMRIRKRKKKITPPKRHRKLKVLVHRFDKTKGKYRRMALLKFRTKKTKWLKIDMPTWTIENDINSGNKTIQLRLSCKRCAKFMTLDLLYKTRKRMKTKNTRKKKSTKKKLSQTRPFLLVYTVPAVLSRSGRSADACAETTNQTDCCTSQLYVDFREIGWDNWIIFPAGFTTSVCHGGCHKAMTSSATCSVTSAEPLSVVYYRRQNVIVRTNIPDLIHTGCGCRQSSSAVRRSVAHAYKGWLSYGVI